MGARGVIGDRWSMRILWACAIGSAASLYMVAAERQAQNRQRMLAEELKAMEAESGNGECCGNSLCSQKVHDSGLKQLTNRQCRAFGASKFPSSTSNYLQRKLASLDVYINPCKIIRTKQKPRYLTKMAIPKCACSIGLLVFLCLISLSNAHEFIKSEAPARVNRKMMGQDKPMGQGFGSGVGIGTGTGTGVGIGKGIGSGGNGVGIGEGYGIGTGSGYGEGTGIGIGRGSGNGGYGEGRGIGIGTGDGGYGEGRGIGIGTGDGGYGPGNGPWASGPGYRNSGGSGFGSGVGTGTGSGSGGYRNNCGGGCNPGCECPGACFQPGQPNGLIFNKPTQHEQMAPTKMGGGEPITPNSPAPPDSPDSSTKTANEAHHHSAAELHN
ncbi:hypothetical protein GBA52_013869 [Prunus armeniaca]|nr:hypothetical protein GBA52_013869 [Prunus armeniaca]